MRRRGLMPTKDEFELGTAAENEVQSHLVSPVPQHACRAGRVEPGDWMDASQRQVEHGLDAVNENFVSSYPGEEKKVREVDLKGQVALTTAISEREGRYRGRDGECDDFVHVLLLLDDFTAKQRSVCKSLLVRQQDAHDWLLSYKFSTSCVGLTGQRGAAGGDRESGSGGEGRRREEERRWRGEERRGEEMEEKRRRGGERRGEEFLVLGRSVGSERVDALSDPRHERARVTASK
eukprot:751544-Hanusia_phi.AAC.4